MLHARDVKLPAGYKLAVDADDAIVKLTPPRIEVPEAEAATAVPETTTPASPSV
jgi:hypothetical protein